MKRNFTFSKYRIKGQKYNLNFIDIFSKGDKDKDKDKDDNSKDKVFRAKTLLKNKIKIIPAIEVDNPNNQINKNNIEINNPIKYNNNVLKTIKEKKTSGFFNNNINNIMINSKKTDDINVAGSTLKKKTKQLIPINKNQIKSFQNVNQNYVININNNINNSYQIKMHNNQDINKDIKNNNNYDFGKMKIDQSEEGSKNINNSNQRTILTEISDLSCFKSNQKLLNLNSSSFPINDNDLLSFSEDTNFVNNLKNNNILENQTNKNSNKTNKKKKIYINPIEFQKFCKEIDEKLNM